MANLYTGNINTNGKYVNLSTLTGVTFTEGTTYAIQIQNTAWLREGTDGQGFIFNKDKGYSWTCKGDDLYIRTTLADAIINIAEDSGFFLINGSGGGGGTTDGANKSLSNLNNEGNAKFQYAPFSINNGSVVNGENTTLTLVNNIITCAPCIITTADGRSKTFETQATLDVSSVAEGKYSVMKSYTDGSLSLANLAISKVEPSTPSDNDLWLDISQSPLTLKQYNGSEWQVNNDLIYIGSYNTDILNVEHIGGTLTEDFIYTGEPNAYLRLNEIMPLAMASSWEIRTKYIWDGITQFSATIFGDRYSVPYFGVQSSKNLFLVSYDGATWAIIDRGITGVPAINTPYYYKVGFTGAQYYVSYNSDGWDESFTDIFRVASSTKVHCSDVFYLMNDPNDLSTYYSSGQMDLKETSIIIDNKSYFEAYTAKGVNNNNFNSGYKILLQQAGINL